MHVESLVIIPYGKTWLCGKMHKGRISTVCGNRVRHRIGETRSYSKSWISSFLMGLNVHPNLLSGSGLVSQKLGRVAQYQKSTNYSKRMTGILSRIPVIGTTISCAVMTRQRYHPVGNRFQSIRHKYQDTVYPRTASLQRFCVYPSHQLFFPLRRCGVFLPPVDSHIADAVGVLSQRNRVGARVRYHSQKYSRSANLF